MTVIFDFDGTLANTFDLVLRLYNEHAHEFGADLVAHGEMPHLRELGYKKAMKLKKVRWRVLPKMVLFLSREMKKHMDEVKPFAGIVTMLKELQAGGINIGILTSNDSALVQDFLNVHDFPVFDFVVSEKTFFGKEKALKRIIHRYNLEKDQVVYVGDEARDVVSSKKAGVKVYGVVWGFGGAEGFVKSPPDKIIKTVVELKEELTLEAN